MKTTYQELLNPSVINSISGLTLISKVLVDGYLHGMHSSSHLGTGMEFSQYRAYQAGDDLRLLDWKMLARSGKYFVRQAEIESNISVSFILDASQSMLHTESSLSKLDYIKVLTASLAHLAQSQGDAVGLFALNNNEMYRLFPKQQRQQFHKIIHHLHQIEASGIWPEDPIKTEQLHDRRNKEMIFFMTDMYEHSHELLDFIKRLKTNHNEVVVLHIMGTKELDFDYSGTVTFEDLETGKRLKVATTESKQSYLASMQQLLEDTKNTLLSEQIDYHLFTMGNPLEPMLQHFLTKRSKLM